MTIFKQYDSRWGKKNYNNSSSISAAACGPFAVANCIVEFNPSINPMDVVRYMQKHGYAVPNHGTAWSGIPAAMKAFGMEDVKNVNVDKSMDAVWKYMEKGYEAVFLFKGGSRGGVTWTLGGHYVAMVAYKVKNGKHYLRAKDSGGRDHDGFFAYETTMRGLIPQVWVGKKPSGTPKPAPQKVYPKCIDVSDHQGKIDWKKVKASGIDHAVIRAGYGKGNPDKWWKRNIEGAIAAGISHIDVYWFMYSYTKEMARNEGKYCVKACAPYKSHIKAVFADWEYDSMSYAKKKKVNPSKALITEMNRVFCEEVQAAGYKAGFYYNYDYKLNHINVKSLPYLHWYALYNLDDKQTDCYLQQYSSSGKVNGIKGKVDMNLYFGTEPGPAPKPTPTPKKKLKVDGIFGKESVKATQLWVGTAQDGICGKKTTKGVQKKVGLKGKDLDSIWGRKTTRALQIFLKNKGYNAPTTGVMDKKTVMAFQTFLNKEVLK